MKRWGGVPRKAPRLRRRAISRRIGTGHPGAAGCGRGGEALISLADLAMNAFYSLEHSVHITAEDTNHCKENTFAFGCCFAEVEVDIPVGKVRVLRIVNVHDSGSSSTPPWRRPRSTAA
ncbi:molybdopterin-dependent oxidoreductase [Flavonifractor plautii]|nr:molybdopterin-dependent oxidoreductase [Flavonifractor plautii]